MSISINGSTGISGLNGSASSPAIQGGDSDTGIFFGSNEASIATDGVQRLLVDSSGRVGVGRTPILDLDVDGNAAFRGANSYIQFYDASNTSTGYIQGQSNLLAIAGGAGSGNNIAFYPSSVEALRFDSSARTLIGGFSGARNDILFFENSTNITPKVQIETVTDSYNNGLSIVNNSINGYGPSITIGTSGAGGFGSSAAGSRGNGWQNGHIHFASSEGNNLKVGVTLSSYLDGVIADNKVPSTLIIRTAPNTEDAPEERLRMDSYGRHIRKYPRHYTETTTGTYGFHHFAYLSERAPGSDGTARYYRLKSSQTMQYSGTSTPATIRLNVAYNTYHASGAGGGEYIIHTRNASGDVAIDILRFRKLSENSAGGWFYGITTGFSCDLYHSTANGEIILKVNGRTGNGSTYDGNAHIHICCEALGGTFSNNGVFEVIPLGATAPSELSTQATAQTVTWS